MAKDFTKKIGSKNLSSLIPTEAPTPKPVVKKEQAKPVVKKKRTVSPPKPKTPATTVTTFRINNDNLSAIKAVAFWERKKIQDVFNEALESYLKSIPASTLKKAQTEFKKRNS